MNKLAFLFASLSILISFSSHSFFYENYDQLLSHTDEIRSSKPSEFKSNLEFIISNRKSLSKPQTAYLEYLITYSYVFSSDFKKAEQHAKLILDSDSNELIKLRTRIIIINIHALTHNWELGLNQLAKLLSSIPLIEDKDQIENALLVAAIFYNQIEQYSLSLNYSALALKNVRSKRNNCVAKYLQIESEFNLKKLDPELPKIQETIENCEHESEWVMALSTKSYLISLLIDNKNYQAAISLLKNSQKQLDTVNYNRIYAEYYSLYTRAYFLSQRPLLTKEYANKTLEHTKNFEKTTAYIETIHILYQLAESDGLYKQALEHYRNYATADKAYMDEVKAKHLAYQMAEHREFETRNKIKLLDAENRELAVAQSLATQERENYYLLASLLLTLLTAVCIWAYRSWRLQEKLRQLAEHDTLTGIYNRGHFVTLATTELKRCKKRDNELSCVLFDLDRFKLINDDFGHATGDLVLKKVVDTCKTVCRHNDIFGRLGGEEFCILLPGCSIAIAEYIAGECRRLILEIDYHSLGFNGPISASFGVTDVLLSGYDVDDILADADGAMYSSKHKGRNQVTLFRK